MCCGVIDVWKAGRSFACYAGYLVRVEEGSGICRDGSYYTYNPHSAYCIHGISCYVFGPEGRALAHRSLHDGDEQALMRPILSLDCSCLHPCLRTGAIYCAFFSGRRSIYTTTVDSCFFFRFMSMFILCLKPKLGDFYTQMMRKWLQPFEN